MADNSQPFYLAKNEGFQTAGPQDDYLHGQVNAGIEGDSLTETQYLGFSVPEARLHALGYMWHHPNLKIVTGGLMAYQGLNRYSNSAALFDFRTFQSDRLLANDLREYRMANSYSVSVVEPLKKLHMSYHDEKRNTHIDLDYTAITPPVMFGDGKHFEQAMRVTGTAVLRGKAFKVNGANVRDRSWGKLRPEDSLPLPPVQWMTGVFGDDFAFNCNIIDHVGSNERCTGQFAIPEAGALNSGWIVRDGGKMTLITKASKKVKRDPSSFVPTEVELTITDSEGETVTLIGKLLASCPFAPWHNMMAHISLMEWNLNGKIGYGDSQDPIWNDYGNSWREV